MSTQNIPTTDQEWREKLTPEQYDILRRKGTERPFTGEYVHSKDDGIYRCAGCGAELFCSDDEVRLRHRLAELHRPGRRRDVELHRDPRHFMIRTEVTCTNCGSHLGHVFDDGPGASGQRYCINSCALELDRANPAS